MRVVSLLPAATEIVGALGLADRLVGVSHECDFPEEASRLPRVTHCEIHGKGLPSAEVDRWVKSALESRGTLYTLDEPLLRELRPDVILTQKLCDVCAVEYGSVAAFARTLPGPPRVVNLEPSSLEDVFRDIATVAAALGAPERAVPVLDGLRRRTAAVAETARRAATRPRCVLLEWIDPPYGSGHWGPELVEIAGGVDPIGRKGEDSTRVEWEAVRAAAPEAIVLSLCGWKAARALEDLPILRAYPGFADLPAARDGRVFAVDADAYFSRPGPRIVDSLEILAEILHPELFAGRFPPRGVLRATL
jgi:iron complex transport system substrate-binding protein